MKKFQFRLQRLLDVARRREEAARREAARALGDLSDAEARVARGRDDVTAALRETQSALEGAFTPATIVMTHSRLDAAEARLSGLHQARRQAEAEYARAQESLLGERRTVLTLEKAERTAREAWQEEKNREDLRDMDETAAVRHASRSNRKVDA